ncbi:BREX-3 system P-loop-containing protein BrxF [Roseibium sp.]|uniref:BREX-3 system P-loop-containing protein BrxF n=1 Tax=Roseibium sp. TaxID=1936156 RepID=UPI003BAA0FBB
MIGKLEQLVDDSANRHSKLVLLIGQLHSGRTTLLTELSKRRASLVLNVGADLGRKLLAEPSKRRQLLAANFLNDLTEEKENPCLLLDNIELLFDRTLQLDPLSLLKQQAYARQVVAVWPGELRGNRLSYAVKGHPEHQEYAADGFIYFVVHRSRKCSGDAL